jgi:hypothetical protein
MTRLGAVFWFVVVLVAGFTTFKVKYAVQDIEDQLNRVRRHTVAEQQEIRVLTAEWTYLTQPERLAELNRRFLQLAPIAARQMQRTIADIPLRAPAAPATPPGAASDVPSDVVAGVSPDPDAPPTPAPSALTDAPPTPSPASALPATPAAPAPTVPGPTALGPAVAKPAAPVQLAKAASAPAPGSLDALVALLVTPAAAATPASTHPATPAAAAPAALSPAVAKPAARVQLAKAGAAPAAGSLDALVAHIADTR